MGAGVAFEFVNDRMRVTDVLYILWLMCKS